jgi:predicted RNase H-like HicB family nuclease
MHFFEHETTLSPKAQAAKVCANSYAFLRHCEPTKGAAISKNNDHYFMGIDYNTPHRRSIMNYIALIHKTSASDYGVSFPDFPGCITVGKTLDEAKSFTKEALIGHVELMKEMGESIPESSSLDVIMQDADNQDAVAFLVEVPSSKTVRVNVCFPEDLLQLIDKSAKKAHLSRSAYLASLALKKDKSAQRRV